MCNRDRIRLYFHPFSVTGNPREVQIHEYHFLPFTGIIYCRNWEQTIEFYRTGLKLPVLSSTEWFVEFMLNETSRVSVADEARTSIRSSGGNGITVSLQVDDIEQTRLIARFIQ